MLDERLEGERGRYLRYDDEEVEDAHVDAHARGRKRARQYRVGHREYRSPSDADPDHRQHQDPLVVYEVDREQADAAADERERVDGLAARRARERGQKERDDEADDGVDREAEAAPLVPLILEDALRRVVEVRDAEDLLRRHEPEEYPHAEEPEPSEELHDGELLHRRGHAADGVVHLAEPVAQSSRLRAVALELGHVFGRVLFGREDGPEDGEEERERADLKRVFDRERDAARRRVVDAELSEDERERGGDRAP